MGLLDSALKLLRSTATSSPAKTGGDKPWGGRAPDKADYGRAGAPTPDMDTIVTDAEIEAVTGARPVGQPRRNGSDGSETDLGRHVIRESKLANGDEFLISLSNCADVAAAQLAMTRLAEYEKPLDGVGERGLVRVQTHPKQGSSEIGVTALTGNFVLSFVHTSATGKADTAPLADLLRTALARL